MLFRNSKNSNWGTSNDYIIKFSKNTPPTSYNLWLDRNYALPTATSLSDSVGNLILYANAKYIYYKPRNIHWRTSNGIDFINSVSWGSIILPIPLQKKFITFSISYSKYPKSVLHSFSLIRSIIDTSQTHQQDYDHYDYTQVSDTLAKYSKFDNAHVYKNLSTGSANCNGIWHLGLMTNGIMYSIKVDTNYKTNPIRFTKLVDTLEFSINENIGGRFQNGTHGFAISADQKTLVVSTFQKLYLFDFDANTSNIKLRKQILIPFLQLQFQSIGSNFYNPNNLVFSPNGKYLYIFNHHVFYGVTLCSYQYDIENDTYTRINYDGISDGKLQVLDNKIYTLFINTYSLGVINKPDLPCPACDYTVIPNFFDANGLFRGNYFPNTVENYFGRDYGFRITQTCIGDSVLFEGPKLAPSEDKFIWRFSDGFTTTLPGFKRHISQKQIVRLRYNYCDVSDTVEVPPTKPIGIRDTFLCAKNTLLIPTIAGLHFVYELQTLTGKAISVAKGTNIITQKYDCYLLSDSFKVEIDQKLPKPFDTDTIICHQIGFKLSTNTTNAYQNLWSTGSTEPTIEINQAGIYTFTRTSRCFIDTYSLNTSFVYPTDIAKISNVFTPNGDGTNDSWLPITTEKVSEYILNIYNCYGTNLATTSDQTQAWTAAGQPDGLYFYNLSYTDCNKKMQTIKGTVMVLR